MVLTYPTRDETLKLSQFLKSSPSKKENLYIKIDTNFQFRERGYNFNLKIQIKNVRYLLKPLHKSWYGIPS